MRELNLIIEGKKVVKEKAGNYDALSIQTKESLFPKYDPTENQKEAITILSLIHISEPTRPY